MIEFATIHYILTGWICYGILGWLVGVWYDGYISYKTLGYITVFVVFSPIVSTAMIIYSFAKFMEAHGDERIIKFKRSEEERRRDREIALNSRPITPENEVRKLDSTL